ncbi:IS30 family transposase [Moraxella bovoculi]|uniref:IS30 family transposase n=1 Tax=Moraxella bovoculi TaxID=386891 RepID=UPI000E35BB56|nr:IS30 family transposase [Moraxella bovoculi]
MHNRQSQKSNLGQSSHHQCLSESACAYNHTRWGGEFAKHQEITDHLKATIYFPPPRQPWQKGSNENTNGLLREYFPKASNINHWDNQYIQTKAAKLNLRPRKCLNWRTPYEVYYQKVLQLV